MFAEHQPAVERNAETGRFHVKGILSAAGPRELAPEGSMLDAELLALKRTPNGDIEYEFAIEVMAEPPNLPSGADLDAVAQEQKAAEDTGTGEPT